MNIQKFTQKSVEAIQNTEKIAREYGNQEIDQEHLLYALLTQNEGLIPGPRPRETTPRFDLKRGVVHVDVVKTT